MNGDILSYACGLANLTSIIISQSAFASLFGSTSTVSSGQSATSHQFHLTALRSLENRIFRIRLDKFTLTQALHLLKSFSALKSIRLYANSRFDDIDNDTSSLGQYFASNPTLVDLAINQLQSTFPPSWS